VIHVTIIRISEIATSVAAAVEQHGAMTSKIASSVQQAALNTTQVSTDITEVNREAVETGLASARIL
jgi:methyl-accepting chemotaxis protein